MKFLDALKLSTRFCILFAAMIALTAFCARAFFVRQERNDLDVRLQEKAAFIAQTYSLSIAAALMQKDDVMLLQVINVLEKDQEISSVVVVDQNGEVRYHADSQQIATVFDDPLVKNALKNNEARLAPYENSGGHALALVTPLKLPGVAHALGAVRIDFTYRRIENQLSTSRQRYWFVILGAVVSTIGFVMMFLQRWLLAPLQRMRSSVAGINVAVPEPNLPDQAGELGDAFKAINELVLRFKLEAQQQWANQNLRAEQEKAWIQRLTISFLPGARILIADKDNRVISDTNENVTVEPRQRPHLLDLIKDANFANLLTVAFQHEGEVVRGPVTFQNSAYNASILSVPLQQSVVVKTLIALQPT